ncbi:cytosolic protein [Ornithinibacillus halophilus]|uniref:Cytosolic protein n=1 Tax=Ornithinibacillus halophilus TaxID=930117 RepID=A0A1M5N4G7_9BACI|nr:cytosolic protein [Ornithinibacillus halophilus]SHG84466.1 hypothetical protein SAMN05216225_10706 [Ornithinibacillus halophilus]
MALRHTVSKYLNNHAETSENHWDPNLKTKYYKTTKDKALRILEDYYKNAKEFEIQSVSEEHGEIGLKLVKGKKAFIIVTVIMVRPFQTAVDFSITTESILPFDFGYSHRLVKQLYEQVNKDLPLLDRN